MPDESEPTPRRRRKSTTLVAVGVAVLAGLWVAYWYGASRVASAALNRMASAAIAGHVVDCADERLGGFPLRIDLRCQRTTYANAAASVNASVGGLSASAPLYRPGYVAATLDSPLLVNARGAGVALTVTWSLATADATAWLDGITGAGAQFLSVSVDAQSNGMPLPANDIRARSAEMALRSAGGGDYRFQGAASGLQATIADGRILPEIDGEATITALDVGPLGTDPPRALLAWLRAGGTATIDRIRLAAGNAVVTADGQLTLGSDGLLSGNLVMRFNSIEALGELIMPFVPARADRIALALQALNAVSVPVETPDGPLRQTSLTFTDGVAWLGIFPLPIEPIPPILF